MHLMLIGADIEENLGMGMIAGAAVAAGHRVSVLPFPGVAAIAELVAAVCKGGPQVVGLAARFQHRGDEFLALSRALRALVFGPHHDGRRIPTRGWHGILSGSFGVESVVLNDRRPVRRGRSAHLRRAGAYPK